MIVVVVLQRHSVWNDNCGKVEAVARQTDSGQGSGPKMHVESHFWALSEEVQVQRREPRRG